nr:biotin--[acetyl-CoA-carboxylase] ligase [Pseudomarimonas arenosa]
MDWAGVPVWFFPSIDSTNSEALRRQAQLPDRALILAAEQSAGRGRLGRQWQARAGGSLCLSVFYRRAVDLAAIQGLGPALGLAAASVLRELGVVGVALKWPNDLQVDGLKLGGILVEVAGGAQPLALVAGIGINVDLGDDFNIDQPWTDLRRLACSVSVEHLAKGIGSAFLATLDQVCEQGLPSALTEWSQFDALAGRYVQVIGGAREGGEVLGIADDGRLRLRDQQGEWCCHSGEVSVRAVKCC